MANQTVVSAAAIWQGLFDTLTAPNTELDFVKQGEVYFVEKNAGSNENDGSSWEKAFRTIAKAIETSNTNIGANQRGWASRNTIFIKGDFTETLSTAPEKCDLVGVGSTNARTRPRITGAQVMTNTAWGTRFINIEFRGVAGSATMVWTAGGFEIHNCVFSQPTGETMGTHAITVINPTDVLIQGCDFGMSNELFFSTICIALTNTEVTNRCQIIDCKIRGAVGVNIAKGDEHHWLSCSIENCYVYSSGLCVDDEDGKLKHGWALINNRFVTQAANTLNDMLVYNEKLSVGNIATGASSTNNAPEIANL